MEKEYQFLPPFKKQVYPGKNFYIKFSVVWNEYTFFNQRNEIYVEEDIQFLPPFKKGIPKKTYMPKNFIVWSLIQFFNQRNKKYVEEDYHILPPFHKTNYPGKNFHTTNSVFEINILFSTKETKYTWKWKKTINFCHLSKNKLSR